MIFSFARSEDRLTLQRPGTRWLSNGIDGIDGADDIDGRERDDARLQSPAERPERGSDADDCGGGDGTGSGSSAVDGTRSAPGGYVVADAAHNLTVPTGFDRTDLATYVDERLGDATPGPTLLTGVSQTHARGARRGPVEVVVTAGLSNPAVLPMDVAGDGGVAGGVGDGGAHDPGTVNVFVGTDRALDDGALVGLLATAVEAKAATLLDAAGVPGTTSDAVVVGCDPDGGPSTFAGSATDVGAAARVCVREAIQASLRSRYGDDGPPDPADVDHGVVSADRADVFEPD